ncbi:hypothetical protein DR996_07220 [Vibrio owensii]|nr:hypothetical protein DR996_07220 [Vibrio owensii]
MIIFIGPVLKPVTGQSLAFNIISKEYDGDKKIFLYTSKNCNTIVFIYSMLLIYLRFISSLIVHRNISSIYITTSRSTFGFFRDMVFIVLANLFSIKVVNHLHGADFRDFRASKSKLFIKLIDFVYKKVNISIVLLPKMIEQYEMYEKMRVVTVSNCAIPSVCDLVAKPKYHELSILYLSNIMFSKGIIYLISAVDKMVESNSKVSLHVAGNFMGDDYMSSSEIEEEFKTSISNRDYIHYHGSVSGKEKDLLLSNSDVFVLPSFYPTEAQPISIIEAMMAKTAIITTNHNYLPDMVTEKNGYLINPKSTDQIVAALKSLDKDRERLNSICEHNYNHAMKEYTMQKYVDEISHVLNDKD